MPQPLRFQAAGVSPYDQRPVTTSLLSRLDAGNPSAYPGPAQNVETPATDQTQWMTGAIERRLSDKKKEQSVTGKTSDGKAKADYITPRYT